MECLLCCNLFHYRVLTECSHNNVCATCLFRLRTLLDDFKCPVDRTNCKEIFIVSRSDLTYAECAASLWGERSMHNLHHHDQANMYFEEIHELQTLKTLAAITCPVCNASINTVAKLSVHVRRTHDRYYCELCLYNRTLFPVEHPLFTAKELDRHTKSGDEGSSFKGHVKCQLCPQYSYDSKTLVAHIREFHYFCDLCPVERRPTFASYSDLESHYIKRHFMCMEEHCRHAKHVVFTNYTELSAHYSAYHPGLKAPLIIQPNFTIEEDSVMPECLDLQPKTFRVGGDEEELKIDFPALSSAAPTRYVLDYSRLTKKPPTFASNYAPLPRSEIKPKATKGYSKQKFAIHPLTLQQVPISPDKKKKKLDVPLVHNASELQRPPTGAWAKKTPVQIIEPVVEEVKGPSVQSKSTSASYKDIIRDNCSLLNQGFINKQEFLDNYFKVVPKKHQRSDETLRFIRVCLPSPQLAQELSDLIVAVCVEQPIDRPAEEFPSLPTATVAQPKAQQKKRKQAWTSFKLGG
mmetsp:Transcript_27608/g.49799  ORF Transcript_27608/g.49799 Transcript_27608/m.49799 type:complete len:520 (+) Transcript_27608:1496-3055(+)